jgi:UPF0716 protein FxsA
VKISQNNGVTQYLLLLFVLLPLIELALLTALAQYTSLSTAILFIILTGLLGTWLARSQGLRAYQRIQVELQAGRMPTEALLDGLLILLAGVLLIAPGVLTDLLGILLMLPPSRVLLRAWAMARFGKHFQVRTYVPTESVNPSDVVDTYATETRSAPQDRLHNGEESAGI